MVKTYSRCATVSKKIPNNGTHKATTGHRLPSGKKKVFKKNVTQKKRHKLKKQRPIFIDSDNSSDFESLSHTKSISPEFSLKRLKPNDKEEVFNRLFDDVKKRDFKPVFSSGFDSTSIENESSSHSDRVGLFKSLTEKQESPRLEEARKKKVSKRVAKQKKTQESPKPTLDRVFSNETLEWVTRSLKKIDFNAGRRLSSDPSRKLDLKPQTDCGGSVSNLLPSPIQKFSSNNSSPRIGKMVTSTPALLCRPKNRFQSDQRCSDDIFEGAEELELSRDVGTPRGSVVDPSQDIFVSCESNIENEPPNQSQSGQMKNRAVSTNALVIDVQHCVQSISQSSFSSVRDVSGVPQIQITRHSPDLFENTRQTADERVSEVVAISQGDRNEISSVVSIGAARVKNNNSGALTELPSIVQNSFFSSPQFHAPRANKRPNTRRTCITPVQKRRPGRAGISLAVPAYPARLSFFVQSHRRSTVFVSKNQILREESTDQSNGRASRCRTNLSSSYILSFIDEDLAEVSTSEADPSLLTKILKRCTNDEIISLSSLYDREILLSSKKIGEGAFGEVFLLSTKAAPVLKIVPVGGSALVNGQSQTKLNDILAEIIVSKELSNLQSYVQLLNCFLSEGEYPEALLELWDQYDEENGSENDRPDPELFQGQEEPQKFVVLEFSNGGSDLEHTVLKNAAQGLAVFNQIAHALAIAEERVEFEHRDLHWGNILVRKCKESSIRYNISKDAFTVKTENIRATIIDFSLSRLKTSDEGCIIFNNLAEDEDLFKGQGDYQFEIYRLMREHTENKWRQFQPKTNIFWLHYLLDKLLEEVKYKNTSSKLHHSSMASLSDLKQGILQYDSALQFVRKLY